MYQIIFERAAVKALEKMIAQERLKVIEAIEDLAKNPRPNGCKKLKGQIAYRIRIGNYRVIYSINDKQVLVLILDVGNRKEIYT